MEGEDSLTGAKDADTLAKKEQEQAEIDSRIKLRKSVEENRQNRPGMERGGF